MPIPQLTQGDLEKHLPAVTQSLHGEGFYMLLVLGAVWDSDVRVLMTHSRCSEEDPWPGFRK